ncbi:hydroxyacid dehydrogenase [Nocardia amamiensis]|uniref:Hydroxyacid dehydrogenase n=1 Tax=Nocardia amamiensis TaxID=404578 RepID=A0ABS0CQV3_9NOCA|nr:hydroxyacid dehydrogenase [Nocardia amamiensis]MBF6299003.1 hydroxyacid dehydrogenase [Nocardia amamiensis]
MKIAIYEVQQWEHTACLRLQPEHELICSPAPLDTHTAAEAADADVLSTFIRSRLDADVLERFPKLQLVATRSTGYDHIDLGYCAAHGITVSNVPDYGDSTVAEHVFALILGLARHLVDAAERTRRGGFSQAGLRGFELRGKTLGVIGAGRIGRRVIEIAGGFGMAVVATDLHPDHAVAARLGFRYADLDDTLAAADILTLHVPATADTVHLISDREFDLMKAGAVLINTARGRIVDVAALIRALTNGKVKAAGLDVLPEESVIQEEAEIFRDRALSPLELRTLVAEHVLFGFSNVLITPHNAYNTDEAVHRIIETTLRNIEAFARGEPRNTVPP